jgi:hypothetical protein
MTFRKKRGIFEMASNRKTLEELIEDDNIELWKNIRTSGDGREYFREDVSDDKVHPCG